MASNYRIGIGISEVTDTRIGLQMQGFADTSQKTAGVESQLYSRAFIVADPVGPESVVIVSADIWSATSVVKLEVVKRLQAMGMPYTSDNVLISGTHTHSAPGGYTGYKLYDLTGGGFDDHTYQLIVSGMVASYSEGSRQSRPGQHLFKQRRYSRLRTQPFTESLSQQSPN
jgi:neutral ceramidase